MQNQKVEFDNDDGLTLSGSLDLPTGQPVAYALFAHCFTCSKNLKAAANISRALNDAGIAVLRFDFTGLGQSEGEGHLVLPPHGPGGTIFRGLLGEAMRVRFDHARHHGHDADEQTQEHEDGEHA